MNSDNNKNDDNKGDDDNRKVTQEISSPAENRCKPAANPSTEKKKTGTLTFLSPLNANANENENEDSIAPSTAPKPSILRSPSVAASYAETFVSEIIRQV